ncbi:MAG: FecR family protein [Elusimicrobiota bacterium]|jgi:ferric-dicitrate binding protein FerR (iron transport regulator)
MRKLPFLVLPLLLAAACAKKSQPPLVIADASGTVRYQTGPDGLATRLSSGSELADGGRITTDQDGRAAIVFPDGSRFELGPRSDFTVERAAGEEPSFKLALGRLKASIVKASSRRLYVRTPRAVACVRGTEFNVSVRKSGRTTIDLFTGQLSVSDDKGKSAELSAGQRLVADAEGLLEAAPIPTDIRQEAPLPGDDLQDQAQAILPKHPKRGAPMRIPDADLEVDGDKPLEAPR